MNIISKVILTATTLAISAPLMASGGYGGGGGFSGGGGGFSQKQQRDPAQVDFSRGKSYFKKYVTCKKCTYKNGVSDSVTAEKAAKKVRNGEIAVKEKHKRQLLFYISRRYRIRA